MQAQEKNGLPPNTVTVKTDSRLHRIRQTAPSFVLTFLVAIATWIVLSGKFDAFHLSLGVLSSLAVAFFSRNLLFANVDFQKLPGEWFRFVCYLPWLIYQVFVANIHVMYLVFHPRMMDLIDPQIIQFKSRLKTQMGHYIFANSITLTPGTITVHVSLLGDYSVHSIDRVSGEALPGEMEEKILRIMDE